MKKQILSFMLGVILTATVAMTITGFAKFGWADLVVEYADIKIELNGHVQSNVAEPFILNGTTFVPIRAISEYFGKYVNWDSANKTVQIYDSYRLTTIYDGEQLSAQEISENAAKILLGEIVAKHTPYPFEIPDFSINNVTNASFSDGILKFNLDLNMDDYNMIGNYTFKEVSTEEGPTEEGEDNVWFISQFIKVEETWLEDNPFPELGKPVIYLYPTEETDVSVAIDLPVGNLTFTYPEYKNGWNVSAKPDGTLTDSDGKEYSYLFYEAENVPKWTIDEGFVVSSDDTIEFLQEKLTILGLTPKEYNEFIVYWAPKMMGNDFNKVKFIPQQELDSLAPLTISPTPDTIKRVFMVFEACDERTTLPTQTLSGFERNGFTVVEWGGDEIK